MSDKRADAITWTEYFFELAKLSAKRSKDPVTQVGACIVDDFNRVVSLGYNGFPVGCSDDDFPWDKTSSDKSETKYYYVVHAELNAILNAPRPVRGCTMYVTLYPCQECAKAIIQSGIKKVNVLEYKYDKMDTPEYKATERMFNAAGVEVAIVCRE